jgi:hypothetical protein
LDKLVLADQARKKLARGVDSNVEKQALRRCEVATVQGEVL